jgi:hypothetical protein
MERETEGKKRKGDRLEKDNLLFIIRNVGDVGCFD